MQCKLHGKGSEYTKTITQGWLWKIRYHIKKLQWLVSYTPPNSKPYLLPVNGSTNFWNLADNFSYLSPSATIMYYWCYLLNLSLICPPLSTSKITITPRVQATISLCLLYFNWLVASTLIIIIIFNPEVREIFVSLKSDYFTFLLKILQ